jgi:hypothetical protein
MLVIVPGKTVTENDVAKALILIPTPIAAERINFFILRLD